MITTLVFDIGGVFLHNNPDTMDRLAARLDCSSEVLEKTLFGGELWEAYRVGEMSESDYWQACAHELSPGTAWTDLRAGYEATVVADMDLAQLVSRLKTRYAISALSNAGAELERRLTQFGLYHLFDEVINSHRVHMAKPDAAIFQHTAALIGARPEETLFVDDRPRNTEAAAGMGFYTHVYTNWASFVESLAGYGIDPMERAQ